LGDGFAYVGNRATSEVCAVNAKTLAMGACLKLTTSTDAVSYVAATKEVWVTTPRDQTITVLDASKPDTLKAKTTIKLDGSPEGYAVDDAKGLFYSNLEDKNKTLVIDAKTHTVKSTWNPGCGNDGPRGLAVDSARGFVIVACTDHLAVLDGGHEGAIVANLPNGGGVDNIDFVASRRLLYVASGKSGKMQIVKVDDKGQLTIVATATTADRARNAVADDKGGSYVIDPAGPRLLAFPAPTP
jgi:DNA-binding beta-propeller fold protein YncE